MCLSVAATRRNHVLLPWLAKEAARHAELPALIIDSRVGAWGRDSRQYLLRAVPLGERPAGEGGRFVRAVDAAHACYFGAADQMRTAAIGAPLRARRRPARGAAAAPGRGAQAAGLPAVPLLRLPWLVSVPLSLLVAAAAEAPVDPRYRAGGPAAGAPPGGRGGHARCRRQARQGDVHNLAGDRALQGRVQAAALNGRELVHCSLVARSSSQRFYEAMCAAVASPATVRSAIRGSALIGT